MKTTTTLTTTTSPGPLERLREDLKRALYTYHLSHLTRQNILHLAARVAVTPDGERSGCSWRACPLTRNIRVTFHGPGVQGAKLIAMPRLSTEGWSFYFGARDAIGSEVEAIGSSRYLKWRDHWSADYEYPTTVV